MLIGIIRLEAQGRAKLSRKQARLILAALQPWQNKPVMSYWDAQKLDFKLKALLNGRQHREIGAFREDSSLRARQIRNMSIPRSRKKPVATRFMDMGVPDDPMGVDVMCQWIMRISNFSVNVNPFYPPGAYAETSELPLLKQKKMQFDYQNCRLALAHLERKAGLQKRRAS